MNDSDVKARLGDLASGAVARGMAARLRDLLPDIERAAAAGVSMGAILAELRSAGLEMSLATFTGTLARLRKQAGTIAPRKRLAMSAAKPKDQANPPPPSPAITKPTPPVVPGPTATAGQTASVATDMRRRGNPYPPGSEQSMQWIFRNPPNFDELEAAARRERETERAARIAARAAAKAPSTPSAPTPSPTGSPPSEPGAP